MTPWRRAAVRSWVEPGNAGEAHSSRPRGSARTCTFTVSVVLSRVVGPIVGEPVDADQRAVEDEVPQPSRLADDPFQIRCLGSEQVERLADVPVDGGRPDVEPGGQPSVGVPRYAGEPAPAGLGGQDPGAATGSQSPDDVRAAAR